MLKIAWKWVAITLVAILIIWAIGYFFDFNREICEYNQEAKNKECALYSLLPFSFIEIAKTLNDYGAAITALATVIVAGFTGTLWRATDAALSHSRQVERAYVSGGVKIEWDNHDALVVGGRP